MALRKNERVVAIVGRPNVGKSALFNRLAGRRIAIVHDQPGVTRDRLSAPLKETEVPIQIIDTGGIGAVLEDGFADQVKVEASIAIESADAILFVVDVLEGRHPVDDAVAALLRKQGKPVILGLNKADDPKHDNLIGDFAKYGFKNVVPFSATHGRGIPQLISKLEANVAPLEEHEKMQDEETGEEVDVTADAMRLAIIGRPNVGKSSLFNAIIGQNRSIVSNVAGTTRDAVDQYYERGGNHYILIDTAGIRRRARVDTVVESFSVQRAERSIRRADMVAFVFDAAAGITAQERTIAGKILEEHKPCLLVANKYDLYHPGVSNKDRLEELTEYVQRELYFMSYAPLAAVSAKDGQNLNRFFGAIEKVKKVCEALPTTGQLNRFLGLLFEKSPPPLVRGKRLKLYYATLQREERLRPVRCPHLILFVNYKLLVTPTYVRYLENKLREEFGFLGLPIRFDIRERRREESKW
jgi:GTPase